MKRAPALDLDEVLADVIARVPQARTELSPDAATDAVLDAVVGLLAEHGTRRWSMEDVAERAGVGRATVYRRFASRDDLVRAAIAREAECFFAAVAHSVRDLGSLEDQVVGGFVTGICLALESPLGALLRRDPEASMSLLRSEPLLRSATLALVERYEAILGHVLSGPARTQAEVSAEALVRLGLSFVLVPGEAMEARSDQSAHERLARIIRPLVDGRR